MKRGRSTDNCRRAEGRVQTSGLYFKGGGAFREKQWPRRGNEKQEEYLVFSLALWLVGYGRKKSHYLEELQRIFGGGPGVSENSEQYPSNHNLEFTV